MSLTPPSPARQAAPTAVMYAIAAMSCVQIGAATATYLFDSIGPGGTAWLRLSWAAVGFMVICRPRWRDMRRKDLGVAACLGVVSAGMTLFFFEAVARIPLSTAVALEFLGPLAVAVFRRVGRSGLLWPGLALIGVLAMTRPWRGEVSTIGMMFALSAAACWAGYIVLTQRVGDRFEGVEALAISMPAAALAAAAAGVPQAAGGLSWSIVVQAAGLALLLPIIPYALELLALRRLTAAAFGTLMCAEPALALIVGAVMLRQIPDLPQIAGIILVCVAGAGAARTGGRATAPRRAAGDT